MGCYPLRGRLLGNGRVKRGVIANERDVEPVALIATARMGEPIERNFDVTAHSDAPRKVTLGTTLSRSIRHEALASRGVR